MSNVEGRATALTVLSPVRPGWTPWLRLVFWLSRSIPSSTKELRQLSFIHYGRWSMLRTVPSTGEPQRLRYTWLFFESNFNGTWDQYIDAFSEVVPLRMRMIWGSSFGFPGPQPVGPFKDYIRRNELPAQHYYSAYPAATTTEVLSALEVDRAFAQLAAAAAPSADDDPAAFARAYEAFLTDVQLHL